MSIKLLVVVVAAMAISEVGIMGKFDIKVLGDGKDYFRRFFSLSFVAKIHLFDFVAGPIGIIAYFFDKNAATNALLNLIIFEVY